MMRKMRIGGAVRKFIVAVFLFVPVSLLAEPLTMRHAVELALQHANGIAMSAADQQHASASYRELRNSYIPQLIAGAGIGWSDGFPLCLEGAAPSLFNVTAQSALINPALERFYSRCAVRCASAHCGRKISAIRSFRIRFSAMPNWQNGSKRLNRLHELSPMFRKGSSS